MIGCIFGFIVMPFLAVMTFEIARLYLAKEQLQNATDAAVLTATATLASSNNISPTTAHNNAMQAALTVFQQNSILGAQLSSSSIVPAATDLDCLPGEAKLFFQFLDPVTKNVVPISSPNGKVINLYSCAGTHLAFGKYLGISSLQVTCVSKGAVPILDIELCFDVSGSMDDQTPVTFVLRRWDPTLSPTVGPPLSGRLTYDIPTGATTGSAQGTIASILQPPPIGTSLNGVFPQGFDNTSQNNYGVTLTFTGEKEPASGPHMRAVTAVPTSNGVGCDAGQPPGNYPSGTNPFAGSNTYYTDVVVNIDGNTSFSGTTVGGYSFPDIYTLVEAARGNLETPALFTASKANTCVPSSVTPKSGYQAAYFAAAKPILQPIAASQAAALTFADILNTDTDCHFGLVAFDDGIGTANNPTVTISNS
jgi:Putative Flp pilus-assembly TadE/G-like